MMDVEKTSGTQIWANQIRVAWRDSVEAICKVGQLLSAAKADLPHGQFETMIETLPFGARSARMLMAIAMDDRIRNHGSELPSAWRTLYELTRLSDEQFETGLAAGDIKPEMQRVHVLELIAPKKSTTPLVDQPAVDDFAFAGWLFAKGDEKELATVISWLENCQLRTVAAALKQRASRR